MQKKMTGWIIAAALVAGMGADVFAANGDAYTWPGYRSDLDYDTKSNLGDIQPPTKFNNNCSGVTGKKAGKWWAFYWGKDRDSRITDVTIDSILKKYDTDFEYLYNEMGWAPDAQAQEGQYSAVYYYGSGTCAGGAKTDTTGGWQTWVAGYTAVAASFYPLYSFNTSCPYRDRVAQMDAMIHEGIHSMTNGYPGAKDAHWFQEAGNTWIQQDMFSRRDGVYSGMGFLNAATVIAPFMPIETYSGWLIDGTFGGPGGSADNGGVTGKNQRYLLGGSQYSNIFPTFMGTWLGTGSVRWIYGNAYGKTKYLLETYALDKGLGEAGVRRLITEFRARLALLDMKKWSNEIKSLLNNNFGSNTYWEQDYWDNKNYSYTWKMTPYQSVTANGDYLVPNQDITPGWSGANYIPLKVQSGAKQVSVSFFPNGSNSNNTNMNFLICYRATDGTPVYSEPITGEGTATLRLDKTPSSTGGTQMVFAVVVNTDFQYTGNTEIRKKHYDYKLKLESGISGAGDAYTKYYNDFKLDYAWPEIGDVPAASSSSVASSSSAVPKSSSSVTLASSSSAVPVSSSSVNAPAGETAVYEIKVTLPIDENYAPVVASFDVDEVAQKLGLKASALSEATFFAQEPGGNKVLRSTANAPGHWFGSDGKVVEWGENAYVFSEADLSKGTLSVGHYPNRVSNGETYSFMQGISNDKNSVLFNVRVTITNEEGSGASETTTALMYGLEGLPTHMQLKRQHGMITVQYSLPQRDNVKISLFTGYGALVAQEITGRLNAGVHTYSFDLAGLPAGMYIVKVSSGSYREARPISITR
ncbi:MAG: DUF4859 domain-containing protein [Fibrobacter sp.]|nr:DUF4859 domain-containing protein [Fibrobacter sp.]